MRPRPAPFSRVVKYGSKIRFRFFSGMPTPVSATSIFTYGPGLTYAISPGPMMTFAPRIRTVPPPGIACAALITRLPIAWPICPASASVAQRSSAIPNSHRTGIPWTDSRADSRTTLSREIRSRTGFPPFEKVRSLEASSSARSEALSAASSLATALLAGSRICFAREMFPRIAARKLLKSWAMPPARVPRDSSFCHLTSSSSLRTFTVTSRKTKIDPAVPPAPPGIAAALSSISRRVPSRATSTFCSPALESACRSARGSDNSCPVRPSSTRNTSRTGRPAASSRLQPVIPSACRFMNSTFPSASVVMTPSAIDRRVICARSFSRASWPRALRSATIGRFHRTR